MYVVFFGANHDFNKTYTFQQYGYTEAEDGAASTAEGTLLRRVSFVVFALYAVKILRKNWGVVKPHLSDTSGFLMIAYCLWCLASVTWSDSVSLTVRRCILLYLVWFSSIVLSQTLEYREILKIGFYVSLMLLLTGIFSEIVHGTFRPGSLEFAGSLTGYRFSGTIDPNTGSWIYSILILNALYLSTEAEKRKYLYYAAAFLGFTFLVLSKTRTSFAALIFVLSILAVTHVKFYKLSIIIAAISAAVLAFMIFLPNLFYNTVGRTLLLGRLDNESHYVFTLSGRVELWDFLIKDYISKRPLFGYGYGAFWTPNRQLFITEFMERGVGTATALSGYFDLLLQVGFVGFIFYMGFMVLSFVKTINLYIKTHNQVFFYGILQILLMFIIMITSSFNFVFIIPHFIILLWIHKMAFDAKTYFYV